MRFGTWNVRTLYRAGAAEELTRELVEYQMDITAIQEIRWPGEGTLEQNGMIIIYGGNTQNKHELGTGFVIKKELWGNVLNFKAFNDRISKLRIKGKWKNITMINVHAPTEEKEDDIKEDFYNDLEDVIEETPKQDILIVLGDFNAKIGREQTNKKSGRYGKPTYNFK